MVKVPTKHGLDRKFKSWRKGKSEKANKKSSQKQQLRGLERLLAKFPEDDKERRAEMQQKIEALKTGVAQQQQTVLEKKNAEQAHGQRFLDRQRLTRKEKQARKIESNEEELLKLALDQVYVAHHPNDVKYMPLFQKGGRVVDQSRQLYRRAITRGRVLRELEATPKSVNWIPKDQYERLPKNWTIQDEERVFGGSISRKGLKEKKNMQTDDSRFAVASQHEAVLQAANQIETQINQEEEKKAGKDDKDSSDSDSDSSENEEDKKQETKNETSKNLGKAKDDSESDSSSDDSDDDDEADPLKKKSQTVTKPAQPSKQESSDSSSSEDDSDSDDDAKDKELQKKDQKKDDSSSDDSSSSSDSDSSDGDDDEKVAEKVAPNTNKEPDEEEEVDDFLVDADDDTDVFQKTTAELPAWDNVRNDKSKGWETQQERPGHFKRKRIRR